MEVDGRSDTQGKSLPVSGGKIKAELLLSNDRNCLWNHERENVKQRENVGGLFSLLRMRWKTSLIGNVRETICVCDCVVTSKKLQL